MARRFELPVLVHTPHRDKAAGTTRTLDVVKESGLEPHRVVVDHLNEVTVKEVADSGCWMGFSIYPDTKMDPDRMVVILQQFGTERILVNSAADWGKSDPLRTYATGQAMLAAGFTEDDVDQVLWRNPVAFYGQSGRLDLSDQQQQETFEGNSILRGARVMRFRHPDGSTVHLAYCTNVHPAEDLDGVIAQLDGCSRLVRKELDVPVLGVGLWLAHTLADRLANSNRRAQPPQNRPRPQRPGSRHPERLPVRRIPRPRRRQEGLLTRLDRGRPSSTTPSTW